MWNWKPQTVCSCWHFFSIKLSRIYCIRIVKCSNWMIFFPHSCKREWKERTSRDGDVWFSGTPWLLLWHASKLAVTHASFRAASINVSLSYNFIFVFYLFIHFFITFPVVCFTCTIKPKAVVDFMINCIHVSLSGKNCIAIFIYPSIAVTQHVPKRNTRSKLYKTTAHNGEEFCENEAINKMVKGKTCRWFTQNMNEKKGQIALACTSCCNWKVEIFHF